MKWLKGFAGCLTILLLAGCSVLSDKDNATGGLSRSKVTLALPSGISLKPNGHLLSTANNTFAAKITSIDLTVTAVNMITITQNIPLATLETTIDVPSGVARTFEITVLTDAGITYTGSQVVDLEAGAVIDLVISVGVVGLAPTAVTATAGKAQVTLTWGAVSGATSYNMYWSTSAGVTPATGNKISGVVSPYLHTGLTDGTKYYYIVTSVNAGGESVASAEVSATTDVAVPIAPTGVGATAGDAKVAISWTAVTNAASYNVYYGTATGVTVASGTKIALATSGSAITGLANGTTYYFIVTAVNASGESAASSEVSATPKVSAPSAPTGVGATAGDGQVAVSWKAVAGATSYNVYYSNYSGVTTGTQTVVISGSTTTITSTKVTGATSGSAITGFTNGSTYYFVVTAVNAGGESAASSEVSATPKVSVPSAPTNVSASPGNAQVTVSWTVAISGATSNVYYGTSPGVTVASGTKIASATSGSAITGLTNGTTYYFIVTAVTAGGESAASSEVSAIAGGAFWKTKTSMPTARGGFGVASINGVIYAIGGTTGGTWLSVVEAYDPGTNTWSTKASMPTARGDVAATAVNGLIYAIGGWNGADLATVEAYDFTTNTWVAKASMTTARSGASVAVVNGSIYAIGGSVGGTGSNTVEVYNPVTNAWSAKAGIPTARIAAGCAVINGKIYVIGGNSASGGAELNTVEEYNPITNTWATKATLPTARYSLAAEVINGTIIAMGGKVAASTAGLATVEEYNPVTNTWGTKVSMPTTRCGLGASTVNGAIFALGGSAGGTNLAAVEAYSPAINTSSNTWVYKSAMITARQELALCALNGKIYAIGGWVNPTYLASMEEYDTVTSTWTNCGTPAPGNGCPSMATSRAGATCVATGGKIHVMGGYNGTPAYLANAETYDLVSNTWGTIANSMSANRYHPASAELNGKGFVMGGMPTGVTYLNTVDIFDYTLLPATPWSTGITFTNTRYMAGAESYGGKIFLMGGFGGTNLLDIQSYDPVAATWTSLGSMPLALYGFGIANLNGLFYISGGTDGGGKSATYSYNPATGTWTTLASMGTTRWYHKSVAVNGKVYAVGGAESGAPAGTMLEYTP